MKETGQNHRILVAGLGNCLLRDDGVGVHAVRRLAADPELACLSNVQVVEVGTNLLDALHLFEWADCILVLDAMKAGGPPGTVYFTDLQSLAERDQTPGLHELDVVHAFRLMQSKCVPQVATLGVEPAEIAWGVELTAPVEAALQFLMQTARDIVLAWHRGTDAHLALTPCAASSM